MPWGSTSIGPTDASNGYSDIGIASIISTGELKSDFSALAGGQLSNITVIGTSETATVCFKPSSRAFRSDNNTKYDEQGNFTEVTNQSTDCGDPGSTTFHCEWCVK